MQEIIKINNVSKIFKVKNKKDCNIFKRVFIPTTYRKVVAVSNINLGINKGEFVGLVGNNGAGKSTLIKMITGILYNTKGSIEVFGNDPYKKRLENNKKMSAVFGQRTRLKWDLSAMDSFRLLKVIYNINDDIYNDNLNNFFNIFGMESFVNQPVRTLSLGQKMKCEITSAFLHNPQLVLLDEPTIGLDIFSKEAIINFLLRMKKKNDVTIILTTHDMNEIYQVCDRAVFIDKGNIILDESIKDIIESNIGKQQNFTDIVKKIYTKENTLL